MSRAVSWIQHEGIVKEIECGSLLPFSVDWAFLFYIENSGIELVK